jgi:prepilin-type N-terminal cleavage/methylation domain-containing protein
MKTPKTGMRRRTADGGFTLVELLIAMTLFLIIGGCAFVLFQQQVSSSLNLQGQVGLNLSLRNAAAQLQMDLANAGMGYFQNVNIPSWPVGVSIVNNVVPEGSSCYSGGVYGASCFDQINIITTGSVPAINATDSTGGSSSTANCSNTHNSSGVSTVYGQAAQGQSLATTAANYSAGDQLLFLNSTGSKFTTALLTAAPKVAGSAIQFTINSTNSDGSNTVTNDPLDITACGGNLPCSAANKLGVQYCGGDWILKLAPIIYKVDTSTPSDNKLTRTQSGVTATVMDQVIGFKVGAAIWNGLTSSDVVSYNYDSSSYTNKTTGDEAYNFTLVRSVRMSLIARTAPGKDPYAYKNSFDQGAYTVQGIAVVVNPRNMSMND